MSTQKIKQHLERMLAYLEPHWGFVNCHMVNYLSGRHWETFVPKDLRAEVTDSEQALKCIEAAFWQSSRDESSFPAFREFIAESKKHRLRNLQDVLTTTEALADIFAMKRCDANISIAEFMSEKKRHEVELMAELVENLIRHRPGSGAEQGGEAYVIDAGDGKGYLSSRLVLQYKHRVLGIDCDPTKTENALHRSRKLQRAWKALIQRADGHGGASGAADAEDNTAGVYKTTSQFITAEVDFVQLLREHFTLASASPTICLVGLHTCGDLAANCLKAFHCHKEFKILCNIGCCYHLLNEEWTTCARSLSSSTTLASTTNATTGFPISEYLRARKVRLGRNARMLASQSVERTVASQDLPNASLYHRALLDVLLGECGLSRDTDVQVGKVRRYKGFQEYVEICSRKAKLNLGDLDVMEIAALEEQFAEHKRYLDLFYLLRMTFAPILETLILLDRLLYLRELGYENSYLVPLFDAVISPRHFCIVAVKN